MPEFRTEGELRIFIKKSFEDKEGKTVDYSICYFLLTDDEGIESVLTVNTKQDLSDDVDKHGVITVRSRPDGKMSLVKFQPAE